MNQTTTFCEDLSDKDNKFIDKAVKTTNNNKNLRKSKTSENSFENKRK